MNCYLSWNLKDMTNISAEKLQKNISQQTSYIQLYRSELTKEAYKFNIGSLLRHVCTERSSFGTEPIQRRATDCLIIFLHAAAFQKVTYFAPTDAENPAVAKCARNLHRLMLENVKSTMRFIDYEVLQKHARGEIDASELFSERERIHNAVFPDESLLPVSDDEGLNAEFLKLVEMETKKARTFVDFDVQRNSSLQTELCQKLAKVPRSESALPESRYGLIGSCRSSLETPFIRYGNSYYSFVTAYSLRTIADTVSEFAQENPAPAPEPVLEEEPDAEEPVIEEPVPEEPISEEPEETSEPEEAPEETTEPEEVSESVETEEQPEEPFEEEPQPEPEPEQEEPAEAEEIIEEPIEEPEPETEPVEEEPEPQEEPSVEEEPAPEPEPIEEPVAEVPIEEPLEEEPEPEPEMPAETADEPEPEETVEEPVEDLIEEPVEEDIPFEEPVETYDEPEMTEASDEEEEDEEAPEPGEVPVEEPVLEQMASDDDNEDEEQPDDPFDDDEDDPAEDERYTALVSPDAYDYLEDGQADDFQNDSMLEEQDYESYYDDEDDDEEVIPEEDDEPDPYSGESLFSIMDDSEESEPAEVETVHEETDDNLVQKDSFPADEEEPLPAELPQPPRPQEEEPEAEPEPQEEPVPETEEPEELRTEGEPLGEEEPVVEPEPEPETEKPAEQPLPLLEQILSFAPSKNNPIAQYLNSCQYEQKKEIVRFIELARKAWLIDGKDKVFSIPDTGISVAVFAQTQDPMLNIQRRENIGAVMFASQKDSWNSLEISYDGAGQMVKADYIRISRNSFSDWEWKIVEKLGTRLMERRGK